MRQKRQNQINQKERVQKERVQKERNPKEKRRLSLDPEKLSGAAGGQKHIFPEASGALLQTGADYCHGGTGSLPQQSTCCVWV